MVQQLIYSQLMVQQLIYSQLMVQQLIYSQLKVQSIVQLIFQSIVSTARSVLLSIYCVNWSYKLQCHCNMALNYSPEQNWHPATESYLHISSLWFTWVRIWFTWVWSSFARNSPVPAKSRKMTALVGIVWGRNLFSPACCSKWRGLRSINLKPNNN